MNTIFKVRTWLSLEKYEFADQSGIPRSQITRWESGAGSPDTKSLNKILAAFESVFPGDLLPYCANPAPSDPPDSAVKGRTTAKKGDHSHGKTKSRAPRR